MKLNREKIKSVMYEKNIRPVDISRITGIPKSSISMYLSGEIKKPPISKLKEIADVLGVSVEIFYISEKQVEEASPVKQEEVLSVAEAAKMLHCSEQLVRRGIINNDWNPPIGSAIRTGGKYRYHIPLRRVELYLGGA